MKVDSDKSKEDMLEDNLSFMTGRMNALSEIQAYIEREISETDTQIRKIKSYGKISLKDLARSVLRTNLSRSKVKDIRK